MLFRVALVLLKNLLGTPAQIAECPSLYEIVERLKHIPPEVAQEDFIVAEVNFKHFDTLNITKLMRKI